MNPIQNLPPEINPEFIKKLLNDPKLFVATARRAFFYFFYFFFGEYITHPIAPYHMKMFEIAQDSRLKRVVVVAFRNSAKSTILNTAYILWAIMGIQGKKHVVIASQTQHQAKDHLRNIRREIEKNPLLRKFLGPFQEMEDRWSAGVLIIPRYGARITAVSVEQEGIRGLREGPHRPDLMILDDIEDSVSTVSREMRDKTFRLITGELLPGGDIDTKVIFLGNFVHDDCVLARIEDLMKEGKMDGRFYHIPLVDDDGAIAWPGKFPTTESVEEYRRGIGDDVRWFREFLLKYVPEKDQLIKPEDIHYYDEVPLVSYYDSGKLMEVMLSTHATGVDLAIGKNENNDCTAMVSGRVIFTNKIPKIYIDPTLLNDRLDFNQTMVYAKALNQSHRFSYFYVENVAYQQAAIQEMQRQGLYVKPMKPSQEKKARLAVAAIYIKNGMVVFPRKGCELLLQQLFYSGAERHDDLVDALVYLILGLVEDHATVLPEVIDLTDW